MTSGGTNIAWPEWLEALRRRRNSLAARRIGLRVVAAGAGFTAAGSLLWVLRGHGVPGIFPLLMGLLTAMAGAVWLWSAWSDRRAAAVFADGWFGLKDGFVTALHLEAAGDPVERALAEGWLERKLEGRRPEEVGEAWSKPWAAAAVAGLAAAVWLGVLPPSAAVRAAEDEAERTREFVEAAKEELEKLVEDLEEEIAATPEKEGLEMDEFRKLVDKIDESADRTEAARQFARLEQKVREAARALDQRRDEETLSLAGKELAKAEETEARKLGKKLEEREWKEAEEMMKELAEKDLEAEELKQGDRKKLEEAKEELAKMRAVTKRLKAAAKQRQAGAQAAGGEGAAGAGAGGGGAMAGAAAGAGGAGEGEMGLEEMMGEMDEALEEMGEMLGELEIDPDAEWADGEFEGPFFRAKGLMNQFRGKLRRMDGRARALGRLAELRDALEAFQGEEAMLGLANVGGAPPGVGSAWSERQEKDDSQKNGSLAQLKGQQGSGPSLSAVEDAESGTGVSGRRGTAKEREFSRQVESFVQRDDVPEALKLGVRNYFENVQSAKSGGEE